MPYPDVLSTQLEFRGKDNFAFGLSTNQAENFQGYHGKAVLTIVDEAPGIEPQLWDAFAGIMAGGKVHIVLAGNPTIASGPFFDAFTTERALWNCLTVDAFDSPNLIGLSVDRLLQLSPEELDRNPVPYLVTRRWVFDQNHLWWHGDELSSQSWMARVRGEFPSQAQNALIKLNWLERVKWRAEENPAQDTGGRLVAGVDVGGGQAETVVYLCEPLGERHKILTFGAWRGENTRGAVVKFLEPYRARLSAVRVDAIGIGHNFGLHLRDCRFPVELVNVGLASERRPGMGQSDPAQRFANLKAQLYQNLADAFEHDQIDGLVDDATIGQLASVLYEVDSHGRIKIEPKDKARQRAEALMMAFAPAVHDLRPIEEYYGFYRTGEEPGFSLSNWASEASDLPDAIRRHFQSRPQPREDTQPTERPGARLIEGYLRARARYGL